MFKLAIRGLEDRLCIGFGCRTATFFTDNSKKAHKSLKPPKRANWPQSLHQKSRLPRLILACGLVFEGQWQLAGGCFHQQANVCRENIFQEPPLNSKNRDGVLIFENKKQQRSTWLFFPEV